MVVTSRTEITHSNWTREIHDEDNTQHNASSEKRKGLGNENLKLDPHKDA